MKRIMWLWLSVVSISAVAQGTFPFSLSLQEVTIPGMPGIQSYASATSADGKWLLVCGRTDGLHDHRPPFSFPVSEANDAVWVVDPVSKQVWSAPISGLPVPLQNALSATNVQFEQIGDVLYLIGGYGVDGADNQYKTYSYVTAIDVPGLVNAVQNSQPIGAFFAQISDSRLKVTGGYLTHFNGMFHLVCGQAFDGRYNPHNGPSFTQAYTESIKRFNIVAAGGTLQIQNYTETVDAANLHRRDYNLVPQIFANGDTGATVFSGVFQQVLDIPHFNTVDVTANGYAVRQGFNQLLNQYHTAHMAAFDAANNSMHTLFFGGIGMYYHDAGGNMVTDSLVPFVKTISMVTRFANDSMVEYALPVNMPGYMGAGAEFIPSDSVARLANNTILDLNTISNKVLVGHIVGGIESTDPNIFMFASSGSSAASARIFKVYLQPGAFSINDHALTTPFSYRLYPNPTSDDVTVEVKGQNITIELTNVGGRVLKTTVIGNLDEPTNVLFSLRDYPAGVYLLRISSARYSRIEQVVKY